MSTQPLLQRTAGKRIALPVRVEPKVFFANERTWCLVMAQLHRHSLGARCGLAQLWRQDRSHLCRHVFLC
ncbi:hypothetical protein, partial [Sporisorium scitamineum]